MNGFTPTLVRFGRSSKHCLMAFAGLFFSRNSSFVTTLSCQSTLQSREDGAVYPFARLCEVSFVLRYQPQHRAKDNVITGFVEVCLSIGLPL
jgi:hypothetical protein